MAEIHARQSIIREDTQHLVMSMGHIIQAVIACKGYEQSTKHNTFNLHNINIIQKSGEAMNEKYCTFYIVKSKCIKIPLKI